MAGSRPAEHLKRQINSRAGKPDRPTRGKSNVRKRPDRRFVPVKSSVRKGQHARIRRRRNLKFEQLEVRQLLSTDTWKGGGTDTNWMTGNNWVGNTAPTAGDNLVFEIERIGLHVRQQLYRRHQLWIDHGRSHRLHDFRQCHHHDWLAHIDVRLPNPQLHIGT